MYDVLQSCALTVPCGGDRFAHVQRLRCDPTLADLFGGGESIRCDDTIRRLFAQIDEAAGARLCVAYRFRSGDTGFGHERILAWHEAAAAALRGVEASL